MKFVFFDTEFTGANKNCDLISIALITLEGKELYITLNDYDINKATDWVKKNVLRYIENEKSVNRKEAYLKVSSFLKYYSQGEKIHMVSAGKTTDLILLFQLYDQEDPKDSQFDHHQLPNYLNHNEHIDLNTLFFLCGVEQDIEGTWKEDYANFKDKKQKHNALYDARVVQSCFLKLAKSSKLKRLINL